MMNYEKMLFFPKTEMSSITSFAAPPPPQSFASAQTQAEAATPATAAAFLAPSDTYASYADNFDLSLLPLEGDSELSPAPSAHALNVSLDYIPTTVYRHTATPSTTTTSPDIKIEQTWPHIAASIKNEPPQSSAVIFEQLQEQRHQKVQRTKSESLLIPPPPYPHPYPSPESSPTQSDYSFHAQFGNAYSSVSCSRRSSSSLYPPSPCPSLDTTVIKQEFHILPPSPPESSCEAPSPHSFAVDVKAEPLDADVETLIDINSLLENTYHQFEQTGASEPEQKVKQESTQCCQDHQVLREYLEDTTFQKKHNLKPLALETLIGGLGARGDIEPVISLALEHAKREAEETCAKLQISPDPKTWSATQVHAWLRSTVEQFKLQQIDDLEIKFPGDGATLALLTEEEFVRRAPETGSTIHAQLEIWKLAYSNGFQDDYAANAPPESAHSNGANGPSAWPPECGQQQNSELRMDEGSDDDDDDADASPPTTVLTATATPTSSVDGANAAAVPVAKPLAATPTRNGGAHIHLWQFLKELLAAPHVNGTAIRWIERSRGVFKIEDSVRVAKLWGRRKNRPAMNYDKLSRSIRQYYKKGIMKKTERSQRLVYQFCHPYNL